MGVAIFSGPGSAEKHEDLSHKLLNLDRLAGVGENGNRTSVEEQITIVQCRLF